MPSHNTTDQISENSVFSRLSDSIDKLSDACQHLGKVLVVHEEKINSLDTVSKYTAQDIKNVNQKIYDLEIGFMNKLTIVKEKLEEKLESTIVEKFNIHEADIKKSEERIASLERSKYWVMGVYATITTLATVLISLYK